MRKLCKFAFGLALLGLVSCAPCSEGFDISAWQVTTSGIVSVEPSGQCDEPTSVTVQFMSAGFFKAKRDDSAPIGTTCDASYTFRSSCDSREAILAIFDTDIGVAEAKSDAYGGTLSVSGMTLSGDTSQVLRVSSGKADPCSFVITAADMVCE